MDKYVITKEDKEEFKKSNAGMTKYLWLRIGVVIDLLATLSVCLLYIYSYKFNNSLLLYILLYALLVIVVVGGELIGMYFGALDEYVMNKNRKKKIDFVDE